MAEPSGVIGIIGFAAKVIKTTVELGLDWNDAPAEAKRFILELQSLETVLFQTFTHVVSNQAFAQAFYGRPSALLGQIGSSAPAPDSNTMAMVTACREELEKMLGDLVKRTRGHRYGWERFKGALLAARTREAVENLQRRCMSLNQLLQIDTAVVVASTNQEVKETRMEQRQNHQAQFRTLSEIQNHISSEESRREHEAICNWLTPIDYATQFTDFLSRRQPKTGQWLLDSPEFKAWVATKGQTLFCSGLPGAGKTILTTIIIEHLRSLYNEDPDVGVAYLYCNFRRHDGQKIDDLIANLLKQLARRPSDFPKEIKDLYKKGAQPQLNDLLGGLRSVAGTYSRLFVVVDALDECQTSGCRRSGLLKEIFDLQNRTGVNFFATSRSIPGIVKQFEGVPSLEIRATREDIERYLQGHLNELHPCVMRNTDLQQEIVASIADTSDGIFLLAQLLLKSLDTEITPKAVRKALAQSRTRDSNPSGANQKLGVLQEAYDRAMERINAQMAGLRDLATRTLSWITCAVRPLTTLELQHALAVEPGEDELDEDNLSEIDDILSACAGLVTVDQESHIMRLVHHTTQEYFERTQKHWLPNARSYLARTCTAYLSFRDLESICRFEGEPFRMRHLPVFRTHPFHNYAVFNWGVHAGTATDSCEEVLSFLQNQEKVAAAGYLFLTAFMAGGLPGGPIIKPQPGGPHQVRGLHLAAFFGFQPQLISQLLASSSGNLDVKDVWGRTPLSYAASQGHTAVMRMLLDTGRVDVNANDDDGRTPLSYAAQQGKTTVVELLLGTKGIRIDKCDNMERTPLSYAAREGNIDIVQMLLGTNKVDVNAADIFGRTVHRKADEQGHDDVVQLLLAHGATAGLHCEEEW